MSTRELQRRLRVQEDSFYHTVTAARISALILALAGTPSARAEIAVDRIALHQFEDGPVLPPAHEFLPGETIYLSCLLTGYRAEKSGEESSIKLAWQMRVADPAGVPLEKETAGRVEDKILPEDKNWKPKFVHSFVVPPYAV